MTGSVDPGAPLDAIRSHKEEEHPFLPRCHGHHEHRHSESPGTAHDAAVASLRAHRERVTDAGRAVIDVLARTRGHISADQMPHTCRVTPFG